MKIPKCQHFNLAYDRKQLKPLNIPSQGKKNPTFGSPCRYIYIMILPKINGA